MQTLPNGMKKVEASDNVTIENLNRNDELLDEKLGEMGTLSSLLTTAKTSLVAAINEVFQSASNLKAKVAAAITGMGQAASASDTADQLAARIGAISSDATAVEGEVLAGRTFYKGGKRTGTMVDRRRVGEQGYQSVKSFAADGSGALVIEPKTGYYEEGLNAQGFGSIFIHDTNFVAPHFRNDITIFGMQGSMPTRTGAPGSGGLPGNSQHYPTLEKSAGSFSGDGLMRAYMRPLEGYYDGTTWITTQEVDLLAENIRAGYQIFGVTGTLNPLSEAYGDTTAFYVGPDNFNMHIEVTGLNFLPKVIYLEQDSTPVSTRFRGVYVRYKYGSGGNESYRYIRIGSGGIPTNGGVDANTYVGDEGTYVANGGFRLRTANIHRDWEPGYKVVNWWAIG